MGIRFRKKIKVLPGISFGLYAGKKGVTTGLSAGPRGAKMSVNSKGQVRRNLSIPGTGVYSSEVINKNSNKNTSETTEYVQKKPFYKRIWFWCVVGIVIISCLMFW